MAERVLSWREINRSLLARQLLLERAPLTPVRAVERLGGLQTQYAPSGYVGLWSRLEDFHRDDLTDALIGRRIVLRDRRIAVPERKRPCHDHAPNQEQISSTRHCGDHCPVSLLFFRIAEDYRRVSLSLIFG